MGVIKTKGLVIKEVNVGEADKILTLFCERNGKIQVSARGARRPKSRLLACSQFLCYSDFVLYKGKDMYSISQCEMIENFFDIRISVEKLSYATYLVELAREVLAEGQGNNNLLKLLLNTLHMLSQTDKCPRLLKTIYELRLMGIIGFAPNLIHCVHCGETEGKKYFNSRSGGLVCEKCLHLTGNKYSFGLSEGALYAMRFILYSELRKVFSFQVSPKVQQELDSLMQDFLMTHVEKDFKSLKYLQKILHKNISGNILT